MTTPQLLPLEVSRMSNTICITRGTDFITSFSECLHFFIVILKMHMLETVWSDLISTDQTQ